MQTIYFTTSNFIRHEGNLVDLTEYRRKLAQVQAQPETEDDEPVRPVRTHAPRRRRGTLPAMMLDCAASAALIVTALTFVVKIL